MKSQLDAEHWINSLGDVDRAWRSAVQTDAEATQAGRLAPCLGDEVRCALCQASLNSLVHCLPSDSDLPAALVEQGLWTPGQGLTHTRHIPQLLQQLDALAAAPAIRDDDDRAAAQATLATHLAELGRPEGALAAAQAIEEGYWRVQALTAIAHRLPQGLLAEPLAAARALQDADRQGMTLAKLAPYLPRELLSKALAAVEAIERYQSRWSDSEEKWREALAGVPDHAAAVLLAEAGAVREINGEKYQAQALVALAPHLPQELLAQALTVAQAIRSEEHRAEALVGMAPHLPKALLAQALTIARAIRWEAYRAEALVGMAPHLPKALLAEALDGMAPRPAEELSAAALTGLAPHLAALGDPAAALAMIQATEDPYQGAKAEALAKIAPHLPLELLNKALATAQALQGEKNYATALTGLVPRLAELGDPKQALKLVRTIRDAYRRVLVLIELAPYLTPTLLAESLKMVQAIEKEYDRARALTGLAPHLPPTLLAQALGAVRTMEREGYQADVLAGLAPFLSQALLDQALTAARAIEEERHRAKALAGLAPRLAELGRLEEALNTAQVIQDRFWRARVLSQLAPRLAELGHLAEALDMARAIRYDGSHRAKALAGIAPHLSRELLLEALATAREIKDIAARAQAFAALAAPLQGETLVEALEAAQAIEDRDEWVMPYLPPELQTEMATQVDYEIDEAERPAPSPEPLQGQALAEALGTAQVMEDQPARAQKLAEVAPHLIQLPRAALYPLWQETLPLLARRTRRRLLADLRALAPVIVALGGAEAIADICCVIQEAGRRWP
jgi:hypothetical protein